MDTSGLVIPRETLMHRHPREWLDVCLSSSSLNDRPPREKASNLHTSPFFEMVPANSVSIGERRVCIMQGTSRDVARERGERGRKGEEGQGVESRVEEGEWEGYCQDLHIIL